MYSYFVAELRVVGPHTPDEERMFNHADTTFKTVILSVLGDTIVDAYVPLQTGSELYVMEQFHDYRMVDGRSVVEQAHEIQTLTKFCLHDSLSWFKFNSEI
jgi:hypothetical protein